MATASREQIEQVARELAACQRYTDQYVAAGATVEQQQYYATCTLKLHPIPYNGRTDAEIRHDVQAFLLIGLVGAALGAFIDREFFKEKYWGLNMLAAALGFFLFPLSLALIALLCYFIKWVVVG